jgi:hypothetical protein
MSSKTTTASATYIVNTNSTTTPFAPAVKADVFNNRSFANVMTSASVTAFTDNLKPSIHVTKPGIFTAGTAPEGTASNPTNDSNS